MTEPQRHNVARRLCRLLGIEVTGCSIERAFIEATGMPGLVSVTLHVTVKTPDANKTLNGHGAPDGFPPPAREAGASS